MKAVIKDKPVHNSETQYTTSSKLYGKYCLK